MYNYEVSFIQALCIVVHKSDHITQLNRRGLISCLAYGNEPASVVVVFFFSVKL